MFDDPCTVICYKIVFAVIFLFISLFNMLREQWQLRTYYKQLRQREQRTTTPQ